MRLAKVTVLSLLAAGAMLVLGGCHRADTPSVLRSAVRTPDNWPKVVADYQAWFGMPSHIAVGYSSLDPVVLQSQMAKAKSMGISAFVVDWYGERVPFIDRSYALMQRLAGANHFQVALMYDETEDDNGHATQDALAAMAKAYHDYLAPEAPGRDAYLSFNGRPLIFIFPKHGNTDWKRVRAYVNTWDPPPLLIYKDQYPRCPDCFDGYYAWVHPGNMWAPDGSDWGRSYLERFYQRMLDRYLDKIAVGAAWPGFDDRRASWGLNRRMSQRCGRTLEDSLRIFRRYYDDSRPLPFLMIATWNDYEEGTAIEARLQNCGGAAASQ